MQMNIRTCTHKQHGRLAVFHRRAVDLAFSSAKRKPCFWVVGAFDRLCLSSSNMLPLQESFTHPAAQACTKNAVDEGCGCKVGGRLGLEGLQAGFMQSI
eukprot:1071812-Pelagomonas_calceolata.AAC.5